MTIQLIAKTVSHPEQVPGSSSYYDVPGRLTRWSDVGKSVYEGMLQANDNVGQVTWSDITRNIAKGTAYNHRYGGNDRVAVIDPENADGHDIIDALLWVNAASTGHVS